MTAVYGCDKLAERQEMRHDATLGCDHDADLARVSQMGDDTRVDAAATTEPDALLGLIDAVDAVACLVITSTNALVIAPAAALRPAGA